MKRVECQCIFCGADNISHPLRLFIQSEISKRKIPLGCCSSCAVTVIGEVVRQRGITLPDSEEGCE